MHKENAMYDFDRPRNAPREGDVRIPAGCAIAAIMDRSGARHDGSDILRSIALMHDRSNGLGGGFAAYGIYPEYEELYAFHIMYESDEARRETEAYLDTYFMSEKQERIPTEPVASIKNPPDIWRYFAAPHPMRLAASGLDEAEYTMAHVFHINGKIDGAFVASSGKNMGAFKGVGYPEDIGAFYRICDYDAWAWTAHGRFPTNTPGWWGGAHPFTLLNWSVVHNGEISSYDANRRYVEQFGYDCELQTDTEVITYLFDLLSRRHGLSPELAAHIMTAPAWDEIDAMDAADAAFETALRTTYASALVNGPFSVILGSSEGLLAINDRLKLRALMAAEKGSMVYMASEQAAIELVCPDAENMRAIGGGEPFVVQLDSVVAAKAAADERVMDHDATVRKHFSPSARDKDQCRHACGHAQADGGDGAGERLHDVVERKAGLDLAARAVDEHLDGSDGVGALQVEQAPDEDGGRLGVDGAAKLQLAVGKHLVTHVEAADALAGLLQDLRLVKGVDGFAHGKLLPEVWPVAGARPDGVLAAAMVGCHTCRESSLGCGASAACVWAVSVTRTLAHRPDVCASFFWREGPSFGRRKYRPGCPPVNTQVGFSRQMTANPDLGIRFWTPNSVFVAAPFCVGSIL